jgi:hypothetical protein
VARLVWRNGGVELLAVYAPIALLQMILQLPTALVAWQVAVSTDAAWNAKLAGFNLVFLLFFVACAWVLSTFMVGLSRVMRRLAVEGAGAIDGPGDVVREATVRFFPIAGASLAVGVLIGLASCLFVIPGIIAGVLLSSAVYLVAIGEPVADAVNRSAAISRRNLPLLLGAIVCFGVYFTSTMLLFVGARLGLAAALGPFGEHVGSQVVSGLVSAVGGFPILVAMDSLFIAMETADGGVGLDGTTGP